MRAFEQKPITVKEPAYISLNEIVKGIRQDSEAQDPVLRELELTAMLKLLDQMSQTGIVRVPAILHGAVLAEKERIAILVERATKV